MSTLTTNEIVKQYKDGSVPHETALFRLLRLGYVEREARAMLDPKPVRRAKKPRVNGKEVG